MLSAVLCITKYMGLLYFVELLSLLFFDFAITPVYQSKVVGVPAVVHRPQSEKPWCILLIVSLIISFFLLSVFTYD